MNGHTDAGGVQAQLERFKKSDHERDTLVLNIIKDYEDLKKLYKEKCDDYENERLGRREWQGKCEVMKVQLTVARQTMDSSPFVLALIDGDGAIFQDALLSAGSDGGSDAAHRLHREIRSHILSMYENAGQWAIMVQIYANLEGLAHKLASVNIIKQPNQLNAFVQSFSFNQPLFSFVDVGRGKERADHKVKEMLRLFVSNPSCKHILFAGCHDNGYLTNLDQYKHDEFSSSRITLVESTPAQTGFTKLNYKTIRFDDVFKSEPLPEKPVMPPPPPPQPQPIISPLPTPHPTPQPAAAAPVPTRTVPVRTPVTTHSVVHPVAHPVTHPVAKSPTPPAAGDNTWASVGKSGVTEKRISIAPSKTLRRYIVCNAADERLDLPIGKVDRAAQDSLHQRINTSGKVCNEHHLRGKCEAYNCPYTHGPKLSPPELLVLRNKARGLSCPEGKDCFDFNCYFGHVCANYYCNGDSRCFFGTRHKNQIDTTPATKYYEDGTTEDISDRSSS